MVGLLWLHLLQPRTQLTWYYVGPTVVTLWPFCRALGSYSSYRNHTLRGDGSLTKVTTKDNEGNKNAHHYSKESIKTTCLEEARAQFMQANDTAYMTDPLISNLQVIGIQLETFNNIVAGTYHPPRGTLNNTQQLLPLLAQPEQITDWPTTLTTDQHQQGWIKAKETTSSSFSGVHFGHYKAGAQHTLINALHTMLTDIPLCMEFSYQD